MKTVNFRTVVTRTSDSNVQNKTLSAYPNPATSGKTITLETSTTGKASLIDIKGINRSQFNLKIGANMVTLPPLIPGIYFISMEDGLITKLVIKE